MPTTAPLAGEDADHPSETVDLDGAVLPSVSPRGFEILQTLNEVFEALSTRTEDETL